MGKYISSPSLFYLHMTEAPNHGFAYAKPMYKRRESQARTSCGKSEAPDINLGLSLPARGR